MPRIKTKGAAYGNDGPVSERGPPGTRIKIRGEHFGTKPTDLVGLTVCGIDCLLSAEWKSENKIIAISGPIKGEGEIIVTTRLGGKGTCNVTFKGYHLATVGPMKESAVWVEETPIFSWGRHSLSPSSYQQEDPLGLSVEDNENKVSEEDLLRNFPDKTGDIASTTFSPGWFLLENHQATSFNDLQAGLVHLRRKVQGQKEGQLSFLKANISSVMDQVDTLVNLKERSEKDLASGSSFSSASPCVIDRNIKRGEYDIVINDYIRVKNLFHKTDIPVFKEALNEVEKRIVDLQKKLHEDLQAMPTTVEQQKRLIRYLVNLDSPYDPAWDAIKSRSEYINKKFKLIYNYHKALDKPEASKKGNSATKYSKYNTPMPGEVTIVPACVNFTDEICLTVSEIFPDLWKIGQAYFSGELQVKVEPGRQRDEIALYLPELLRSVRSTYATLIRLDLPNEALDIVSALLLDLRVHCMSILFQQTTEQIKQLTEHWTISFSGKHTGVTELPLQFLQLVEDVIQIVKESALSTEQRESPLLDNQQAQRELEKQLDGMLTAFHNVLNSLASSEDYDDCDDSSPVASQLIGTPVSASKIGNLKTNVPTWEHRLLITLSNTLFTKNTILYSVSVKFKESGFPSVDNPIKNSKIKLDNLERSILDKYLEQKSDPLVGTIEPSMYLGRFDWDQNVRPSGSHPHEPPPIRPYAKEVINNLIHVHAEVNGVSSALLDSVLPKIVETIAEELYRLMSCVQKFSREGAMQARADIRALEAFFESYTSENARRYFEGGLGGGAGAGEGRGGGGGGRAEAVQGADADAAAVLEEDRVGTAGVPVNQCVEADRYVWRVR
ncbi:hypothetical protein NQ318_005730 [Aromia moschata]|uniref:Exocyst complex component 2 n=1 Tax=Aromia moschata TaxID=1265417 RepID=A0AAV8YTW3_9CUCU|nr:hypothetical protein NQ318_005730 [Aromia moschata]